MPWIFLTVAILFEVAGITSMKLSRGLTEPVPSLAVVVFYVCSAAAVILAMKKLELSTAYAIWSGVGTALAAAIGVVYFREPMTLLEDRQPGAGRFSASSDCRSPAERRIDGGAQAPDIGPMNNFLGYSDGAIRLAVFARRSSAHGAGRRCCGRSGSLRWRKAGRWVTNLGIGVLDALLLRLMAMLAVPVAAVAAGFYAESNGIGLLNQVAWPGWLKLVIALLALDLAIWAQHLVSHKVPIFWRLHQVHHADRDIDVTTAIRFHPIEIGLSMLWKIVVVLAIGASPLAVFLFEVILNGCAMFNHANIALPRWLDAILRLFIVTPDMHRVHHSVLHREHDSNYGFNLSIWDRLFGPIRRSRKPGIRA